MREIKFKGKNKKTNEWVYGDLVSIYKEIKNDDFYIVENDNDIECPSGRMVKVIDETVVQYTGLKDINGKEIYEGDIVKYRTTSSYDPDNKDDSYYEIDEVKFIGGIFYPVYKAHWAFHDFDDKPIVAWELQVIGNVYENPELLE